MVQVGESYAMLSSVTKQAILDEQNKRLDNEDNTDLVQRFLDAEQLVRLWKTLLAHEQAACRLFLIHAPQGFLSKRQWERLTAADPTQMSLGLTGLRRMGFILTVRKMWSEIGYIMPQEIRKHLFRAIIHRNPPLPVRDLQTEQLPYYIPAGRGLHLDLFAFLLFVSQSEVKLTKRRTIHRRSLQKLADHLSLQAEHVEVLCQEYYPAEIMGVYRPPEAVIIDLALLLGLVKMEENKLVVSQHSMEEWLQLSPQPLLEQLWHVMETRYLTRWPWMEAFAQAMRQSICPGWFCVETMLEALAEQGYEMPSTAVEIVTHHWLHPLLGFGWVELGQYEGKVYWRWNPYFLQPEGNAQWYIDPSGEIICPPTISLQQLWSLHQIAVFQFDTEWVRLRLTAQQVQKYAAAGGTAADIISKLQAGCAYPLPESVHQLIERWMEAGRQIRVERWSRIRLVHPRLLQQFQQIPSLQPFLHEVISDTDFLIPQEQEESLFAALQQCGYEPQVVGGRTSKETKEEQKVTSFGLLGNTAVWDGYQVENTFPDRLEGVPQLARLPKMWTQHYQSYHPQTLRDLFKRAQELRLMVQFETNHEQLTGTPQKVEVEMGFWYVTLESERTQRKIKVDDVKRVRLLLPEYV